METSAYETAWSNHGHATGIRRPIALFNRLLGGSSRIPLPFFFHRSPVIDPEGTAPLARACRGIDPASSQDSFLPWPSPTGIVERDHRYSFYRNPATRAEDDG